MSVLPAQSPDFLKDRLAKSELFNWIKDGCSGTHEKNVIHIVRGWTKEQRYSPSTAEATAMRNGYLTIAAFTALGVGFPGIVLFAPSMRQLVWGSKRKKVAFGLFCGLVGYVNYNSAHQTLMYSLLQLNNSPYAYCSFQVLCLPQYKRFRNKWQSAYNLSAVAHRYSDFDLYTAIHHPANINMDLDDDE